MFEIVEAKRESAPITAAFIGGSGSGKTYSALLFARGLVGIKGKIVVIDTEGGRSKIYSDDPDIGGFWHLDLVEPYTSERFREAFKRAISFGADAVIIDTISHEHEGFLEFAEQEEARMSGSRAASRNKWIKPKAGRKRFYSAISSSHAHVIATIRLNRIVDMTVTPAKEIMKPECDKDFPYRLDLSVEIQPDHKTKIIKVPKPLKGMVEDGVMIEKKHGQALAADIAGQQTTDLLIVEIMSFLETAADAGTENLKAEWSKQWANAGPTGTKEEKLQITPHRAEMNKHKERLKRLAEASDQIGDDASVPGELGDFTPPQDTEDTDPGDRYGGK